MRSISFEESYEAIASITNQDASITNQDVSCVVTLSLDNARKRDKKSLTFFLLVLRAFLLEYGRYELVGRTQKE